MRPAQIIEAHHWQRAHADLQTLFEAFLGHTLALTERYADHVHPNNARECLAFFLRQSPLHNGGDDTPLLLQQDDAALAMIGICQDVIAEITRRHPEPTQSLLPAVATHTRMIAEIAALRNGSALRSLIERRVRRER